MWQNRRVLVTGHTGFKGGWLSLWLAARGAHVHGFALDPPTTPSFHDACGVAGIVADDRRGDLRDPAALDDCLAAARPEVVFHLAAQPLVRRSYREPLETFDANVMGTARLLEAARRCDAVRAVVVVTTDKVYDNREWDWAYRETEPLGGADPYSASKACAELVCESYRRSFLAAGGIRLATARAGNVIGGGDWAEDRIVPDAMRALARGEAIPVRRPEATRPWQHVLEPLGGYLLLAENLTMAGQAYASAFNFGPILEANRSVRELVDRALSHWPGSWEDLTDSTAPHEAGRLHLQIDKAHHQLGWRPRWPFVTTVQRTVAWYRAVHEGASPLECCLADLACYQEDLAP